MPETDVEAELDRLFQVPPAEFIEARNALAARLRAQGDAEASARCRAIAKPSAAAWAVNRLHGSARETFDALIAAGDQVRALQAGAASADELRDASRQRRAAVSRAVDEVRRLLAGSLPTLGESTVERVRSTLDALSLLGSSRPDAANGRLVKELEPPGFDQVLAAAAAPLRRPRPEPPPAGGTPGERPDRVAQPDAAVDVVHDDVARATAELSVKRRLAETASTLLSEAEQRAAGAVAEQAEAERRLEKARTRVAETASAVADARRRAEAAAEEHAEAARALEDARGRKGEGR